MTLNELLVSLDIPAEEWDLLILGDGSGQGWSQAIGWSSMIIDRQTGGRKVLLGGASHGTINWAELQCALHALRFDYNTQFAREHVDGLRRTHLVTDSQVTANVGNGLARPNANEDLWRCVAFFREVGYQLTWHWIDRKNNPAQTLLDQLSTAGRVLGEVDAADAYSVLPWASVSGGQS